jgi:hypothetical protein
MDLASMRDKCHREQWKVGDLDWSGTPREMSKEDEIAVVQYFTDMAGIERLAGALFAEQKKRATDPVLAEIFATFVKDEVRHSHAAQMLADYYNVHRFKVYQTNPALVKFTPHFVHAIKYLSADIANAYITGGELILDVALLRSLNDHVGDAMSQRAMDLINRDESRHIAIDFHMVEYYCSREYAEELRHAPPRPASERAKAAWAFANVLYYAAPFFRAVFFEPMQHVDPSGRRMKEAFKRMQLMAAKPTVRKSAFVKVMLALQDLYNDHPVARRVVGPAIERFIGVDGSAIMRLYTEAEKKRAEQMSFDELAEDALAAKHAA